MLDSERDYQDKIWPSHDCYVISDYIDNAEMFLSYARGACCDDKDDVEALCNLRKVAAILIRCFENHTVPARPASLVSNIEHLGGVFSADEMRTQMKEREADVVTSVKIRNQAAAVKNTLMTVSGVCRGIRLDIKECDLHTEIKDELCRLGYRICPGIDGAAIVYWD